MTTKVKICGITNFDDAIDCVRSGADMLGFNFYKKSPRFVTADTVVALSSELPNEVLKIGVFVNHEIADISNIIATTGIDGVQLHGDESREYINELRARLDSCVQIIRAVRVGPEFSIENVIAYDADAILLDAHSGDGYGGTGKTFDWDLARKAAASLPISLFLAGGLSPENVAKAIFTVRPYAVDACSLLENAPGKKDRERVAKFLSEAKGAL